MAAVRGSASPVISSRLPGCRKDVQQPLMGYLIPVPQLRKKNPAPSWSRGADEKWTDSDWMSRVPGWLGWINGGWINGFFSPKWDYKWGYNLYTYRLIALEIRPNPPQQFVHVLF